MKTKTKAKSMLIGLSIIAFVVLLLFVFITPSMMSIYKYPTSLTEPGSLPWWSGSCKDECSECQQLDGVVPFTNTIIVDNDWRITNSISTPYVAGQERWECHQVINIYHKDVLLDSITQPDSGGFIVDMTNKIVYPDYNENFITDVDDYMRIRKVKSRYVGEPYYRCDYFLNEIIWASVSDDVVIDDDDVSIFDMIHNYICDLILMMKNILGIK